ncbi:MAG TPA: multicopper oxidase domain-containing protein [Dongiaceae bacterium]|nr:multicopper oxidase domain-containing protein [Dongiaceae bacterium]
MLKVELAFRSGPGENGGMHYCYVAADGSISPTLRVKPGDTLILRLKNEVSAGDANAMPAGPHNHGTSDCGAPVMAMTQGATNLHFHGVVIPPVCHQDETLRTLVQPEAPAFEYRMEIPRDTPPGLYWYHPHPHGMSEEQVLGGASGALIVEGIEQANHHAANLPERVIVIRDQEMTAPLPAKPVVKPGAIPPLPDTTRPTKDLSINYVAVPYPDYPLATITGPPAEKELWRVLNASADTYLDLQIQFVGQPQNLAVLALDGIPIGLDDGTSRDRILWKTHIPLPPASRVEFVVTTPPEGVEAKLITKFVERGPAADADSAKPGTAGAGAANTGADLDDNDPERPIARIVSRKDAAKLNVSLPGFSSVAEAPRSVPLSRVTPVRTRHLYFSERILNPNDPKNGTLFFITEEGQTPAKYEPGAAPNITVHQGDVEDWIIENRSNEPHAFHIHQTHFLVLERHGVPVEEPYLHDTINVPYWDGFTPQFPSIKLRLDFRDPAILGTFPYHCHILQHEDGGMMGTIRVEPATKAGAVRR